MRCLEKRRDIHSMALTTLGIFALCAAAILLVMAITHNRQPPAADPDWRAMRARAQQIEAVRAKESE